MDKTTLVDLDIVEGRRIIDKLDKTEFEVNSAFWLFFSDVNEWRLMLVSRYFDKFGPKKAYSYIQKEIESIEPKININFSNISIISVNTEIVKLLRLAIVTGPSIQGIRFTKNVINNVMIEDTFIYRII